MTSKCLQSLCVCGVKSLLRLCWLPVSHTCVINQPVLTGAGHDLCGKGECSMTAFLGMRGGFEAEGLVVLPQVSNTCGSLLALEHLKGHGGRFEVYKLVRTECSSLRKVKGFVAC